MAAMCFAVVAAGLAFGADGFIASAPGALNWSEAKDFCASKGGRLPLIDGAGSHPGPQAGAPVDGFGSVGAAWPSDLPDGYYWTGTEDSRGPERSWVIHVSHGNVGVGGGKQKSTRPVVCVP
jgi:hypothetical protein